MANLSKRNACALVVCAWLCALGPAVAAQAPGPAAAAAPAQSSSANERGPQAMSPEAIQAAIDSLATVDATNTDAAFAKRMNAARALRRASPEAVTPALIHAVESNQNSYVRFR